MPHRRLSKIVRPPLQTQTHTHYCFFETVMVFNTIFSTLVAAAASVAAIANFSSASVALAGGFTEKNCYGAPIPSWKAGHHPGWYYGSSTAPKGIGCVVDTVRIYSVEYKHTRLTCDQLQFFCELLSLFPSGYHCPTLPPPPPPPPPKFTEVFYNLECASQDDSYLTYGLICIRLHLLQQ